MDSEKKIVWETLEYEERPKTPDWFWALGIIALSTVVASIIYHNFLFAIFVLVAVALLIMYSLRPPQKITVEVSQEGVKVAHYFYDYRHLKSFSIVSREHRPKLLLETDRFFMPLMTIPLGDADWKKVYELLKSKLEDKEMTEPAAHRIMEYLGF